MSLQSPTTKNNNIIKHTKSMIFNSYSFYANNSNLDSRFWMLVKQQNDKTTYNHIHNKNLILNLYDNLTLDTLNPEIFYSFHLSISVKNFNTRYSKKRYLKDIQISIRNITDENLFPKCGFSIISNKYFTNYYDFRDTIAVIIIHPQNKNYIHTLSQIIHIYNYNPDMTLDYNNATVPKKEVNESFLSSIPSLFCSAFTPYDYKGNTIYYKLQDNPSIKLVSNIGNIQSLLYSKDYYLFNVSMKPVKHINKNKSERYFYREIVITVSNPDYDYNPNTPPHKYKLLKFNSINLKYYVFDRSRSLKFNNLIFTDPLTNNAKNKTMQFISIGKSISKTNYDNLSNKVTDALQYSNIVHPNDLKEIINKKTG